MRWLALVFTIFPIIDFWLMLQLGTWIGFWPTLGLGVLSAIAGAYLAKREGLRVIREWQQAFAELRMPKDGVVSGLLVLVGATLLATPGVLTDVVGLVCLFPPTRRPIATVLGAWLEKRFLAGGGAVSFQVGGVRGMRVGGPMRGGVVDVEGEVVRERAADEPLEGEVIDARGRVLPRAERE